MGLYNFRPQFVQKIVEGKKMHTIRAIRVHPDKPGNVLHLYTGLRTKKAKLIARVKCTSIQEIRIEMQLYAGKGILARGLIFPQVIIDGVYLEPDEKESLARRDGFESFADMIRFWREPKNRLPFKGHIIHWRSLCR